MSNSTSRKNGRRPALLANESDGVIGVLDGAAFGLRKGNVAVELGADFARIVAALAGAQRSVSGGMHARGKVKLAGSLPLG